jgi:hypothetical protein
MFKENVLGSEYVNVPTNISSWYRSGRAIIFTPETDIEQRKVSDVSSRNWKTGFNVNLHMADTFSVV